MKQQSFQGRLDSSAVHLLHRAVQCAADIFSTEMSPDGLTPRQYAVLVTVSQNEGLNQTDLVAKTGIDRSTVADIIRRMVKKRLLQRRRTKKDARAYSVRLTEKGWSTLHAAEPAASLADSRILSALPPDKRADFLSILNIIVENNGNAQSAGDRRMNEIVADSTGKVLITRERQMNEITARNSVNRQIREKYR